MMAHHGRPRRKGVSRSRPPDSKPAQAEASESRYEEVRLGDSVVVVSYLAPSGYTLTSMLDLASGEVVAFASNESELVVQHGTFEVLGGDA
jgi:hypothetical protein